MNPPLLEVTLECNFVQTNIPSDRIQYFYRLNSELVPQQKQAEPPAIACFVSASGTDSIILGNDNLEIRSTRGVSFPRLRSEWTRLLDSFFDVFNIRSVEHLSLSYLNEIPLQDLRNFRDYLTISFEMPNTLKERIEFFRSEFTYKYDFGEIHVWLQPDWDDQMENYAIQLSLESRHEGSVRPEQIMTKLQGLHEGIKDVFHQVLSQNYVRQLPQ